MEMIRVFVYGSLLSGLHNHQAFLGSCKKLADAEIYGEMFSLGSFPAVISGKDVIKGEVYLLSPEQVKRLDFLESHPMWYRRTRVDSTVGEVQTYLYVDEEELIEYPRVNSGDWRAYLESKNVY